MAQKQLRRITYSRGSSKRSSGAKTKFVKYSITGSARSGHSKSVYRAPRPSSLSASERVTRSQVFAAHAHMRLNPSLSASQAARDNGVTLRDFHKYLPKA